MKSLKGQFCENEMIIISDLNDDEIQVIFESGL